MIWAIRYLLVGILIGLLSVYHDLKIKSMTIIETINLFLICTFLWWLVIILVLVDIVNSVASDIKLRVWINKRNKGKIYIKINEKK